MKRHPAAAALAVAAVAAIAGVLVLVVAARPERSATVPTGRVVTVFHSMPRLSMPGQLLRVALVAGSPLVTT